MDAEQQAYQDRLRARDEVLRAKLSDPAITIGGMIELIAERAQELAALDKASANGEDIRQGDMRQIIRQLVILEAGILSGMRDLPPSIALGEIAGELLEAEAESAIASLTRSRIARDN